MRSNITIDTASLANVVPTLHIIPMLKPMNVGGSSFKESVAMVMIVNISIQK